MIELITVLIVLATGFITALMPCTFPVLLGFLGYIFGTDHKKLSVKNTFDKTFLFFIGFSIVYIFFGILAGLFGQFTETTLFLGGTVKVWLLDIGGIILIILGLYLLRVMPAPKFLSKVRYFKIPKWLSVENKYSAVLLGGIFGTGLSPCIGPVLAGVLVLASSSSTVVSGAFLLGVFSIGISIPLFFIAYFYTKIVKRYNFYADKITRYSSLIGGVILILLGVSFLFGLSGMLIGISESTFLYDLMKDWSI